VPAVPQTGIAKPRRLDQGPHRPRHDRAAELDGSLQPGGTVVEATAGNTGLGLALVARIKGYRVVLVVPDKMAAEKILHLKALGAEIHLTRSDVGKGHPEYYQDVRGAPGARDPGAWFADQFNNPANPRAHETTTGPELWEQTSHELDAIVVGVGSAGTLTGLSNYFAASSPTRIRAGRSEGFDPGRLRQHRATCRRTPARGRWKASAKTSFPASPTCRA
jgi:cysteine synthase